MPFAEKLLRPAKSPRRFTPDWDLVRSKAGMAGAYAALALGLAANAMLDRPGPRRDGPARA